MRVNPRANYAISERHQPTETTASRDAVERERQKYFELFELAPTHASSPILRA